LLRYYSDHNFLKCKKKSENTSITNIVFLFTNKSLTIKI
jgi:hypothetical protein